MKYVTFVCASMIVVQFGMLRILDTICSVMSSQCTPSRAVPIDERQDKHSMCESKKSSYFLLIDDNKPINKHVLKTIKKLVFR